MYCWEFEEQKATKIKNLMTKINIYIHNWALTLSGISKVLNTVTNLQSSIVYNL